MALAVLLLRTWAQPGGAMPAGGDPGGSPASAAPELEPGGDPVGVRPLAPVPGQFLVRFRAGAGLAQAGAVSESLGPGLKLVRWVGSRSPSAVRPAGAPGADSVFRRLALVAAASGADPAAEASWLRRQPGVLYVEPNFRLRVCDGPVPGRTPNDFDFERQWNLLNTGQKGGTPGADIRAAEAWAVSTGDARIKVAIIDTGVDYYHPDLAPNLWSNPGEIEGNGIDDDQNGFIDDLHGYDFVSDDGDPMDDLNHGTHVAGIVGAAGDNRLGIAGVCWQVNLMALKAFDENGEGTTSDVIEALAYAVRQGAHVINASWSSPERSQALEDALLEAHRAGCVIVAAAGNERTDTPAYPAAFPTVLSVAATDNKDQRASFSNHGLHVGVAAPGEAVYSTLPNDSYNALNGTSMAAPHVAGVAALLLAARPDWVNSQIETILRNAVDPVLSDKYIGGGRIDAAKALAVKAPLPMARLLAPEVVFGRIDLVGAAFGERFAGYTLEYGSGLYPTNWTVFFTNTSPVVDGTLLAEWSTAPLPDGQATLRVVVRDTLGQSAEARRPVIVRNIQIASPMHNDTLRAGEPVEIRGTVFGPGRSYTLEYAPGLQPVSWSAEGLSLAEGGAQEVVDGRLATWTTATLRSNEFYTLKLTARASGKPVGEWWSSLVYLDGRLRPGWPRHLPLAGDYLTNDWREVTVADLDGDGLQDILHVHAGQAANEPSVLMVFGHDGQVRWQRPLGTGAPQADVPVAGDVDGDGFQEVFADTGESGEVFAFRHDGAPLPGWPVRLEARACGKTLADLDGDGKLELICYAQEPYRRQGTDYRQLAVLDGQGRLLRKWEFRSWSTTDEPPRLHAAVANLDDDPELEIVAVTGLHELSLFDLRKPDGPVWTARTEGDLLSSPAVGNLRGDGENLIVVAASDPRPEAKNGAAGGLYAFNRYGSVLPGWPVLVDRSFGAAPALGDLNGDGTLEIVAVSGNAREIHAVSHTGFELPGWPVRSFSFTSARCHPVLGDVDGDGTVDVAAASAGRPWILDRLGDLANVGGILAWSGDGRPIDLQPGASLFSLPMEAAGGSRFKAAAPVLADLDGNGRLDVVATSVQDSAGSSKQPGTTVLKPRYSIYAWELDVPFNPARTPWPARQRDARHSGALDPPRPTNQPPVLGDIPDQTVRTGGSFHAIDLDQYVSDPDNDPDQMQWTVAGHSQLLVTIGPDRVALVQAPGPDWSGQETLTFTARDPQGAQASDQAAFAARPDYEPPLAADDVVSTLEDEAVEFDPLANDSSPRGYPLRISQWSWPQHGVLTNTPAGAFRYLPAPDYNGEDQFAYSLSDGHGGMAIGTVVLRVLPVQDPPVAKPDQAITTEGTPVQIDVLANDRDPDGDPLQVAGSTTPAHGTVSADPAGSLVYAPVAGFAGNDEFSYTITDGHGGQSTARVSVMVKPVNSPPVARSFSYTLNRNTQQDVLYLATDPDGDDLTFRVVQGPAHGSLLSYPRQATYYPEKGYIGPDRFAYVANDGVFDSAEAAVTLLVKDLNNPPKTEPQTVITKPGRPRQIPLSATDDDDDPVGFILTRAPQHGSAALEGTNLVYTSLAEYVGDDTVGYQATDGRDASPETAVTIKVTTVNSAPVAYDRTFYALPDLEATLWMPLTDDDGDPVTYTVRRPPLYGSLAGQGPDYRYQPPLGFRGFDRWTYQSNDGSLSSGTGTVTVRVMRPNRLPATRNESATGGPDQPLAVLLPVTDDDGDLLRTAILKGPQHGRVFGQGTNWTYRPNPGFAGEDSFTFKVWDGQGYSQVARFALTISSSSILPRPVIEQVSAAAGEPVRLRVRGQERRTLEVQVSPNLRSWEGLTNLTLAVPVVEIVDPNLPALPQRFYRARQY